MEIFKKENIIFKEEVDDWKEAIEIACEPLIKNGYVNDEFSKKLISETERLGPYYIMASDLALGHITPDGSSLKNGLSLLFLEKSVSFKNDGNGDVKFLFILSAVDGDSHLNLLKELSLAFGNAQFYKEFYNVKNYEDISKLISKYLK